MDLWLLNTPEWHLREQNPEHKGRGIPRQVPVSPGGSVPFVSSFEAVPQALGCCCGIRGWQGVWDLALPAPRAHVSKALLFFREHSGREPNVASKRRSQEMNFSVKQKSN